MNYKETLFFVAKCLTISLEEENRKGIENQLKTKKIDWEAVVKLSTAHYVFPALYCNLKRANFLQYLPEELVNYMVHITDLNRERNTQIIAQAREVNQLLLENNITPIFLKGTGNLLEGLYEDVAERMVGDIDFILSREEYPKAIELLFKNGYSKVHDTTYDIPDFRHFHRVHKKNRIAAVEIHNAVTFKKYASEFNYDFIKNSSQVINSTNVLSFNNQLSLSIIAKQINDDGFHFKNIALRNAYDVFLLSKKTTVINAFDGFDSLKNPLNCFIASCNVVFGSLKSLEYEDTTLTKKYVSIFLSDLDNPEKTKNKHKKISNKLFIKKRLEILKKSIFNKSYRKWLYNITTDKDWQHRKLIQLGLKKSKA